MLSAAWPASRAARTMHLIAASAGPRPLAFFRGFKKAIAQPAKKEAKTSGRDPYALLKAAIAAEPDTEKIQQLRSEKETDKVRRTRLAEYSRQAMAEEKRVNGHLSRLIKLRDAAIAALPEELRSAALQKDTMPFPIQRRVFTETAPIPDFQQKLLRRDRD